MHSSHLNEVRIKSDPIKPCLTRINGPLADRASTGRTATFDLPERSMSTQQAGDPGSRHHVLGPLTQERNGGGGRPGSAAAAAVGYLPPTAATHQGQPLPPKDRSKRFQAARQGCGKLVSPPLGSQGAPTK